MSMACGAESGAERSIIVFVKRRVYNGATPYEQGAMANFTVRTIICDVATKIKISLYLFRYSYFSALNICSRLKHIY